MNPIRSIVLLFGLLLLAIGCDSGPKVVEVKGTVKVDGRPMKLGQVSFDGGDGSVPSNLEVVDGEYAGKATVGKKTVRISAFRKGSHGGKVGGPGADEAPVVNYVAAKHNSESKEIIEIPDAGGRFDFSVTSK
jgi:hypothetical protein